MPRNSRTAHRSPNNGESITERKNAMSETTANVTPTDNQENAVTDVTPNSENSEATPNSETPSEPKTYSAGNIDPNFYNGMRETVLKDVNEHNQLAAEIKNAGDRVALKDNLLENPEQTNDEELVKLVKTIKEMTDALANAEREFDAKSEPYIQNALKRSGVEEKQAKADEIAKRVKATLNFWNAMGSSTEDIPNLANRAGRNSSTTSGDGRGAGVKKYRNLDVYVDGKRADQKVTVKKKDGTTENVRKSNLTYGAQAAGVSSDVFREAFTNAQGTTDPANFKDTVEFTVKDNDGKEHSVVVKRIADEVAA